MKPTLKFFPLLLLAAPLSAQPIAGEEVIEPNEKQIKQLRALTPPGVEKLVSVTDDSLEPLITVTTEPVWKSNGRFTDKVRSDNFLRAFINKRSGEVTYQLYQEVTYTGDWRRFGSVNYASDDGAVAADVVSITQEVVTCSYGLCAYREALGFAVSRQLLEAVAKRYSPERVEFWRFRFKGRGGLDWEDRISSAEVAGFLRAVDARSSRSG